MRLRTAHSILALLALISLAVLIACSGGGGGGGNKSLGNSNGSVTTTVSDPSTCSSPQGPYSHIYITVADVRINQSATASPTDSGWVDLTPNLTPTQVDLLSTTSTNCFLATLGSNVALAAGDYQQIRVILLDNSKASQVSGNRCDGTSVNCAVTAADNVPHPLQLSSESQTGIKIPSAAIAGGKYTIAAGESSNLNIDFNACASVVIQGNGQYRLKPVLYAGEVTVNTTSISGKVVDSLTQATIATGGKTAVVLEQKDSNNVDRVVMATTTDAAGNFTLCPVPSGIYDLVVVAIDGRGVAYGATVVTGVQPGNAVGNIPIVATTGTSTGTASITGTVTTVNASSAGTSADISLSTLQSINGTTMVTVPQVASSSVTISLATATGASCPTNTACATYTAQVPALTPNVGAYSASGTTFTHAAAPVNYTLDAIAFVPNSGGTLNCNPSEIKSATPIVVSAGTTVNPPPPTIAFTGCQ